MDNLQDFLRNRMKISQSRYEVNINPACSPAPAFQVVHKVFRSPKHNRTNPMSFKLDWKWLAPLSVKKEILVYVYELNLPCDITLHPVFHVSLLDPGPSNPVPDQVIPPWPPVIINNNLKYKIEEILDSRLVRNRLKYHVKWTGDHDPTCEPAEYHNDSATIETFHSNYPEKPNPLKN